LNKPIEDTDAISKITGDSVKNSMTNFFFIMLREKKPLVPKIETNK
jgi:hypothetical protein